MTEDFKRKLTAILSADVVGYSRLMGDDEESTVLTLNKYKELIFKLIDKNNGRVIDSPGDNVLAEFASVVDAVRCGVQIQEDLKGYNNELLPNRKMEFRIGINTGDVIQDGDRIYGDGVNVAARIESLADPGGICVSRTAYDQVKSKINIEYEYLGEYEVKNINEPVRVYRVSSLPKATIRPNIQEEQTYFLSDKPSIAVLPFVNMSGDKEQEYFSDGLAEEIINALTSITGLKVIARTSSFSFRDKDVDIGQIRDRLKVQNILEGSVRKSGNRIRVTAQLINTSDESHLWSERYDREMTDVFVIQDEISQAISEKLRLGLSGEKPLVKRQTENLEAYNLFLKGRYNLAKFTPESFAKSKKYYEQAITLDPRYVMAWHGLAEFFFEMGAFGYMHSKTAFTESMHATRKVLELDETMPEAHALMGALHSANYDWKGAEQEFRHALEFDSRSEKSWAWLWAYYSFWYLMPLNRHEEALVASKRGLELDPLSTFFQWCLALFYYLTRQWDRTIEQCNNALELDPNYYLPHQFLGFTYLQKGMIDEGIRSCKMAAQLVGNSPWALAFPAIAYAYAGQLDEANMLLKELQDFAEKSPVSPSAFAWIYCSLGEIDKGLVWFEKAIDERDGLIIFSRDFAIYDPLRPHPRYKALLKKMNLEP